MRVENGIVVLERKNCTVCRYESIRGTEPTPEWVKCEKCNGTGRRGSGKCRNCKKSAWETLPGWAPGLVKVWNHEKRVICHHCKGDWQNFDKEIITDTIDVSFLPVEIVRTEREQGWMESHFGAGVYTVIDYGRHRNLTDEQIIRPVKDALRNIQASKVVNNDEEMKLCEKVIILTASQGYSALPYWEGGRSA